MKLRPTHFRVMNYKNITDSKWIELSNLTTFVGENDSGKSALLEALQKFKPTSGNPYDPNLDYPRDSPRPDSTAIGLQPVCSVAFDISEDFRNELKQHMGNVKIPKQAVGVRHYAGHATFFYDPPSLEGIPTIHDISTTLPLVKEVMQTHHETVRLQIEKQKTAPNGRRVSVDILESHLSWVLDQISQLEQANDLDDASIRNLLVTFYKSMGTPRGKNPVVGKFLHDLTSRLSKIDDFASIIALRPEFDDPIEANLPPFIYFGEVSVIDGFVDLRDLYRATLESSINERDRSNLALFKVAGLSLEEVVPLLEDEFAHVRQHNESIPDHYRQADRTRREHCSALMGTASIEVTRRLKLHYQQRKYKIRYDLNGDAMQVMVSDDRNPDKEIALNRRSTGFRWYFSFFALFSAESEGEYKNAVLLMDEPALNLHPTAQQDLLIFLEELAEENVVLYTTHSPFMIQDSHPERVLTVSENAAWSPKVKVTAEKKDLASIFPLNATTGAAIVRQLFRGRMNILVEGVSDELYLRALSERCRIENLDCLPEYLCLVPCCGADSMAEQAKYATGHGVWPIILLDSDSPGRNRQGMLQKGLYAHIPRAVMTLSDALGKGEYEIEDVIGEELMLDALSKIEGRALEITIDSRNKQRLTERIRKSAVEQDFPLPDNWKSAVAWRMVHDWSSKNDVIIPPQTLERASQLFRELNSRHEIVKDR